MPTFLFTFCLVCLSCQTKQNTQNKGREHALTDEVSLNAADYCPASNGHVSNFPLSNLETWLYHCAAKFNWMELHGRTWRFKTCASSPNDSQHEVSWDGQQRMWYIIVEPASFQLNCFEQFQRKIISWTIKHWRGKSCSVRNPLEILLEKLNGCWYELVLWFLIFL